MSFLLLLGLLEETNAAIGISAKSGNWNSASTWLINGVTRVPTCGDTITIQRGDTVTVGTQENLTACTSSLYIIVDTNAVFEFTNGNKLDLPCGSTVEVMYNGMLKKATSGGGNSTLISICDTLEWKAGDGDIIGYKKYHAGTSLPVSWLGMNAVVEGKDVIVTWSTGSEINNDFFSTEKTIDGITFTTVGTTKGAGNSTITHNYRMADHHPFSGISYYRVKQTDFDGNVSYSRLAAVNFHSKTGEVKFFPNPVTDNLYIVFPISDKSTYIVRIFDLKGSEVISPITSSVHKDNLLFIDVSRIASGMYTVQVISDGSISYKKLVKE
jgi:hypothetical protein